MPSPDSIPPSSEENRSGTSNDVTQWSRGPLQGAPDTRAYRGSASVSPFPDTLGRYRILRKLGEGGMGAVYLALDTQLEREVAFKVPRIAAEDTEGLERFYREARAAAMISHANLCHVFDVGQIDGIHFMTMAYVEGKTLANVLRDGPLDPRRAIKLVRTLTLALGEAHRRGLVHRDLKPSNIMLTSSGQPVVMDFGLARRTQSSDIRLTQSGSIVGTPAYMSPEQVEGKVQLVGPGSDIYSLGVILYECLSGRLPFDAESMARLMAHILHDEVPPLSRFRPDLSPRLNVICGKAMAKQIDRRYPSMTAFAGDLDACLRDLDKPRTRRRVVWGVLLASLFVSATIFGIIRWINPSSNHQGPTHTQAAHLRALVIGVDKYDRKDILKDLRFAESDATAVADALRQAAEGNEDVILMTSLPENKPLTARRVHVRREMKALFAKSKPEDLLIVFYSGREIFYRDDPRYFLGLVDSDPTDIPSLLSLNELYSELAATPAAMRLVIIDAGRSSGGRVPLDITPPIGVTTLFACSANEVAYEDNNVRHGIFTHYLLEGLRGAADANHDGALSLDELTAYLVAHVADHAERQWKNKQRPERLGKQEGAPSLPIAKADSTHDGFVSLFNGKDLDGWEVHSGEASLWRVEDGQLIAAGSTELKRRGWLLSKKEYGNFTLRFEFKLSSAANTGVTFRATPEDEVMPELQLIDDSHPRYAKLSAELLTGSLWKHGIDRPAKLHPVGEWNRMEVQLHKRRLKILINDDMTFFNSLDRYPDEATPGLTRARGRIGLQNWEGEVRFRDLAIKE